MHASATLFLVSLLATGCATAQENPPNVEGLYQQRTLRDGRTFRIVKVYYDPQEIELELLQ
jgi:hypothetical protein